MLKKLEERCNDVYFFFLILHSLLLSLHRIDKHIFKLLVPFKRHFCELQIAVCTRMYNIEKFFYKLL